MSALITSPTHNLPLRGKVSALRSGLASTFGRRAAQSLLALTAASMLAAPTFAEAVYPVEGYWLDKSGTSIVEIAPCASSHKRLCGTVVWTDSANAGDMGNKVMKSFRLSGNKAGDKWADGKISLAGAKKAKPGRLAVKGDTLKVSVCKGRKCSSNVWTRPSASMTAEAGLMGGAE